MHRIHWEGPLPDANQTVSIDGDEAAHALRVKRLRGGEAVELLDGLGAIASGVVQSAPADPRRGKPSLLIRIDSIRHVPEPSPRIEVWAATPKGGRVDEMIEGLSEVGASAWVPLHVARSIVEPRPTKLDRLMRLAVESAKQCGRGWFLRIERERPLAEALAAAPGVLIILADATGSPFRHPGPPRPNTIRLLIGPEGGWTPEEIGLARAAGARITCFGPHAMRIETAAVAAAAVILDQFAPSPA